MAQLCGNVKCNRIIHFRAKASEGSKKHPVIEGYLNVNATSGNQGKWGDLSPMKLGPFYLTERLQPLTYYPNGVHPGFEAYGDKQRAFIYNLENAWQFSKVYDVDVINNVVQPSFFQRRAKGFADSSPHRRALPKAKATAVAAYWDGKLYDYLTSRYYYCSMYEQLARLTSAYSELEQLYKSGVNLQILGYDGRDVEVTESSMKTAFIDTSCPFGHELVLCCMLKGYKPWLTEL